VLPNFAITTYSLPQSLLFVACSILTKQIGVCISTEYSQKICSFWCSR